MTFARFYRWKDKLIVPTVVQAEEGFYMDVDPVRVCEISDADEIRQTLSEVLARDNPKVPTPDRASQPGSAVLERLHIRKWRAFEADATMFSIYQNENGIEFYSTGPAVNGEWRVGSGKHISLPVDTERSRMVELITGELTREADEETKPKSGGLALLPPPTDA